MHIIAGVDLAWMGARNPTAIAVGTFNSGDVELSSILEGLYGTRSVIEALAGIANLHGVAIDGPLIIENASGMRECERKIGAAYGARKASCHTSNLGRFPNAAGTQLSLHLVGNGFRHLGPTNRNWQLECYPHPALIEIFGLPERLAYKKGRVHQKRSGQIELGKRILSLEQSAHLRLRVPDAFRIYADPEHINSLRGRQLKHNEDVLDAIVCLYIAALYQSGQEQTIFGTTEDGYIYVPPKRCT